MKTNRLVKLAIFLVLVLTCFALDTGLGMFSSALLMGMAAGAGDTAGTENVPDPPQESEEDKIKRISSESFKLYSKETTEKITQLEGSINELIQKASAPPDQFFDAANKDSEKVKAGNALVKAIVKGDMSLLSARHKDFLKEGTDNLGGYLVPPEYNNEILHIMTEYSTIARNARIYNMIGKELKLQKGSTYPSWAFLDAEGGEKSVSSATFGQTILYRRDGGFILIISKSLLEDEAFDLMGYINSIAGMVYANAVENAGYNGNITPEIIGLLNNANGSTVVQADGATFNSLTTDNIISVPDAVQSAYTMNAKWFMHRTIWSFIKSIKKSNGDFYLSSDERKNKILEGYPVELSDYSTAMSGTGASKKFITFGDLKIGMALGQRQSFTVDFSKEASVKDGETTINLWQKGLVGLNFSGAFDIKFPFAEVLASVKTKAS